MSEETKQESKAETGQETKQESKPKGRTKKSSGVLTVKNCRSGHHKVFGVKVAPGETFDITTEQQKNDREIGKVLHAIQTGVLEEA